MSPPKCKYIPTCSQYALEAIERYGVVKGGIMALWRILRCNPLVRVALTLLNNILNLGGIL